MAVMISLCIIPKILAHRSLDMSGCYRYLRLGMSWLQVDFLGALSLLVGQRRLLSCETVLGQAWLILFRGVKARACQRLLVVWVNFSRYPEVRLGGTAGSYRWAE